MANLTAADLTVTIQERVILGLKKLNRGTLAIAGGADYPTGGIPCGSDNKWGFDRQIDRVIITGSAGNTDEYVYGYDRANNKLQAFEEEAVAAGGPLRQAPNAAFGARTVNFVAWGW